MAIGYNARAATDTSPQPDRQQIKYHQSHIADMLDEVEQRYGETAAALFELRVKMEQKKQQMDSIRQEISRLEDQVSGQQKILAAEIKAAYRMGSQEQLKLLLNQNDPALSGRILRYYQYLTQERVDTIKTTERLVADLDTKNRQIQEQDAELEKLLSEKQIEQDALTKAKQQRNQLLARLSDMPAQKRLEQLKQSETVLTNLLNGLPGADLIPDRQVASENKHTEQQKKPTQKTQKFAELKGKLPWPTKGRISQKFGSPRLETVWDGILIEAPEGTEVHAVADGKVVFAKWLKSYGYLMILEHDPEYMTLYAFNQSLFKHKNDTVHTGEPIAAVGQSGGRTQPSLYFAIRKRGVAIDPAPWWQK